MEAGLPYKWVKFSMFNYEQLFHWVTLGFEAIGFSVNILFTKETNTSFFSVTRSTSLIKMFEKKDFRASQSGKSTWSTPN